MECLDFMESNEFKAIDILESLRDCSSVMFLDETLDEAIKELKDLDSRSCFNCDKYSNKDECIIKLIKTYFNPSEFWCNSWEEKL